MNKRLTIDAVDGRDLMVGMVGMDVVHQSVVDRFGIAVVQAQKGRHVLTCQQRRMTLQSPPTIISYNIFHVISSDFIH